MAHRITTIGSGIHQVTYQLRDNDNHGTHNMTNQKRVEMVQIELFVDGQLNPASDELVTYYIGKRQYTCLEIESLDTYQGWKQKGYHVNKGQKAITAIRLYNGRGWKSYSFFSASQVSR